MGIQGLLPLLKSIQRPTELKKFNGETFAVDAYGWLHRGAVSCAIDLGQGKPTRKYVDFAMHRVRMCKHFGVTPYLVFDGDYLPSKKATETSRENRREKSRKSGMELLKAGKPSQAHLELQKAIDVTPEMACHLIEELRKAGIPYVVAPYEADAQMVYLERQGLISGIISEDSDLLVFGAKRLLTKLDQHGQCIEINRRDFCSCREISLTGWTDAEFRYMAILSGCDYLEGIGNLGLKTAYRMIRKHKTPEKTVRMLEFNGKYRIPPNYIALFRQAELTFVYQRVFCPKTRQLTFLTTPTPDINIDNMPFIGAFVEPAMASSIADGDVNPITKQAIQLDPLPSVRKRAASSIQSSNISRTSSSASTKQDTMLRNSTSNNTYSRNTNATQPIMASSNSRNPGTKPINDFFKKHKRIPMAPMEPNAFSMDNRRIASLTQNGTRPIVYPLPRPYLDETAPQPVRRSRSSIPLSSSITSRIPRRCTEPVSNLLLDNGMTLGSTLRRQTAGAELVQVSTHIDNEPPGSVPPPKKARLCEEAPEESTPTNDISKYFASGNKTTSGTKKTAGYLMSDDSFEDALKSLPDVGEWNATVKPKKQFTVFEEGSHDTAEDIPKENGNQVVMSNASTTSTTEAKTSETPISSISRFTFGASSTSVSLSKLRQPTPTSSSQSSACSTPDLSGSSVTISTTKSTPATPAMTPLQRIGAHAMGRKKQPSTPAFTAPRPKPRPSLNSIPINPTFVPLPPVDLSEVEALHQPVGSEDMLVPESDGDDTGDSRDDTENLKKSASKASQPIQLDFSRFSYA